MVKMLYFSRLQVLCGGITNKKITYCNSPDKYTKQDVRFEWRDVDHMWMGLGMVPQQLEFRLPKYVVTFVTDKSNHIRNFGEGKCIFIALRLRCDIVN